MPVQCVRFVRRRDWTYPLASGQILRARNKKNILLPLRMAQKYTDHAATEFLF